MKTQPNSYHIGTAPTSRARCRRCKRQVQKGDVRIVTTAFVKAGHTVRFTRCATCIDAKLAAAIIEVYGTSAHIPTTPKVDPDDAKNIRATITRCTPQTIGPSAVKNSSSEGTKKIDYIHLGGSNGLSTCHMSQDINLRRYNVQVMVT